jgi:hypothetical protein
METILSEITKDYPETYERDQYNFIISLTRNENSKTYIWSVYFCEIYV